MPDRDPRSFHVVSLTVDGTTVPTTAGTVVELLSDSGHLWAIACMVEPTFAVDEALHNVTVNAIDGFEIRGQAVLLIDRHDPTQAIVQVQFDMAAGPAEGYPRPDA